MKRELVEVGGQMWGADAHEWLLSGVRWASHPSTPIRHSQAWGQGPTQWPVTGGQQDGHLGPTPQWLRPRQQAGGLPTAALSSLTRGASLGVWAREPVGVCD